MQVCLSCARLTTGLASTVLLDLHLFRLHWDMMRCAWTTCAWNNVTIYADEGRTAKYFWYTNRIQHYNSVPEVEWLVWKVNQTRNHGWLKQSKSSGEVVLITCTPLAHPLLTTSGMLKPVVLGALGHLVLVGKQNLRIAAHSGEQRFRLWGKVLPPDICRRHRYKQLYLMEPAVTMRTWLSWIITELRNWDSFPPEFWATFLSSWHRSYSDKEILK